MGNYSEFIKATGNCKIMVEKIRKYLIESKSDAWFLRDIGSYENIKKDENGEEFITLEDFGEMVDDSKFYGYFDYQMVSGLYAVYEAMSINGMQCYESKIKPDPPVISGYSFEVMLFAILANKIPPSFERSRKEYTEIDGYFQKSIQFKSYDELHEHFKKFLQFENVPVLKISKGFYDISITIREQDDVNSQSIDETVAEITEETSREESSRKKQKTLKNDEPCKIYFLEEHQTYLYLEFLPYGEGIKLAIAENYPFFHHNREYDREKMKLFFSKVNDKAFCWKVENLK